MAAKYLLVYHGGSEPSTPEEGNQVRDNWMAWFSKLGSAVIDGGSPVSRGWTLSNDGTEETQGSNPTTGYSVLWADSMQAALEMATGCPHLAAGGTIEVCELIDMTAQ